MSFLRRLALALTSVLCVSAAEPSPDPALAVRIARVETGLLPPARIAGAPAAPWTIATQLAAHKVPGVSLAVINDGKIEWARGYGLARAGTTDLVTADTLFQAASISKPVAAVAALTLVDAGKLTLDGDVNEKLTSWKIPSADVAAGEHVTLRRLLSHTAGLTVPGFDSYASDAPLPTLRQILDGTPPANSAPVRVELRPGTKWQYSGGGYCVVQQLLTEVSGQEFAALLRDRVLAPAGMTSSTYELPLPAALAARTSAGHLASGQRLPGDLHLYPEQAAAGLWTTAGDLARFILAYKQVLDGHPGFLKPATAQAAITPPLPGSDYGLGIGVIGAGENLQLAHSGSNEGFRCSLVFYPRTGRGAIIMTNSDNGGALIPEIMRAIAREYAWPDYQVVEKTAVALTPSDFDRFVGRYEREETVLTFSRVGTHFYVRTTGQPRREIFPSAATDFFLLDGDETFSFALSAAGRVSHLIRRAPAPQIFRLAR